MPSTTTTTTTSDEGEENHEINPAIPAAPKFKPCKIAIFFAYCGAGYQGMQKNPGAKTIEGDLEEALYLSGAVPEADRGQPKRFDFARSARTDKGVSAIGQVVSGRFYVDPPGLVERLNSNLPPQIRIFGYKQATDSFNAKKLCDRRRYIYLIPVFALDTSCHRDRESVLASAGSGKELAKCLECSERGRKVFGIMGKSSFGSGISSNSLTANSNSDENSNRNIGSSQNGEINDSTASNGGKKIEFCYGESERSRFNRILKHYEGRHNFHNFTTRMKADDPAANRNIISFTADTVVTIDSIEFVKCEVLGQSFMLHQIRKMIGLAIAIMRNCASESLIATAFHEKVNINVPMAPEVGLYLQECFFTTYNEKWREGHEEVSMEAYAEEAKEFTLKHVHPHIASNEHKEGTVALWLHSLNYRNYPDLRGAGVPTSFAGSDVKAQFEVGHVS